MAHLKGAIAKPGPARRNRLAMAGKELFELVLERRLLLSLLLVSAVFSTAFLIGLRQPPQAGASPLDLLEMVRFAGPLVVGVLVIVLAGDAVARERQDRTLHLLFTAPATRSQYWGALVAAHLAAFAALAGLLMLFSLLVGAAMGWVAVKGMVILLALALLPLFVTLDMLVLACSARMGNGRTSLLLALALVLLLWSTSLAGPFGWALGDLVWWQAIAAWHPFDLAGASAKALLERGAFAWAAVSRAAAQALLAALAAWLSLVTREVGR